MARPRSIDKTGKAAGSSRLTLRFTDAQLERLRKQAERKGCSLAELVRMKVLEGSAA
jgi:hypothetical protein